MTSQKSLKNNVNFNDFKRVIKTYFLIPMVVFVLLIDTTVIPFFKLINKNKPDYALYFGEAEAPLVPLTLIVSFVLSVTMFFFLTKKNQVNVQLSLGITRTRLYLNRVIAGLLLVFFSIFIPLTITLVGNLVVYDEPWLALRTYCNMLFPFLSSGLLGFALGAFVSTISGNIIETIMTTISVAFAPVLIENICYYFRVFLLNGYVSWGGYSHENISMLFNPFCFTGNTFSYDETAFLTNIVADSAGLELLDTNNIMPPVLRWSLFIWSAVAVALLVVGLFLINRRKAENSNSIGKFSISRAINSLMVTLIVSSVMVPELIYMYSQLGTDFDVFFHNEILIFTIFALVSIVVFLVIQLAFRRKIKSALRTIPVVIGYIVAISLLFVFHTTEYFGTFNKLPDVKEIEKIHVNVNMNDYVILYNIAGIRGDNFIIPDSSDIFAKAYFAETEEEIQEVYKLFEIASKSSRKDSGVLDAIWIGFTMTTKDGETIDRNFTVFSESIEEYNEILMNSKYFDSMIDYTVLKADETKIRELHFFDKSGIQDVGKQITIQDEKLYTAILLDYKDMDYEDFYKNTSRPLYFLSYGTQDVTSAYEVTMRTYTSTQTEEGEEVTLPQTPSSYRINVYPEMKRTIAYLEENGYADMVTYTGEIKEVLYTSGPLNCFDAEELYSEAVGEDVYLGGFGPIFNIDELYDWGNLERAFVESKQDKEPDTYYSAIHLIHNTINQPLTKVTDKQQMESIVNNSVPLFMTNNDNGRYIYIVYNDKSLMMYYLPEANVGVLK